MKVCIMVHVDFKDIFNKVAHLFMEEGHEVVFLAWTHYDEERLAKEFPNNPIYSPAKYMRENWDKLDISELSQLQQKYPRLSLWDIFYTERRWHVLDKEEAAKYLVGYVKLFEDMFQREKIDLLFFEVVSLYTIFMAKYIGEYYGARYLGLVGTYFDPKRIFLAHDEYFRYPRVQELFLSGHVFSDEEINAAEAFIKNTIEKQEYSAQVQVYNPFFSKGFLSDFGALFRYFRKIIFRRKEYFNKYDYPLYKMKDRYSMLYLRGFRWSASKKYFERPRYGEEKYYLFTLHYVPEAVVLTSSRKYADQSYAVEQVARVLPAGKMLYVKDHIVRLGHKPSSFYKRISQLQNVRIISPLENTHKLVKNSEAVVVIASTVGIEALIHNKPVYVLGNIYYDFLSSVTKIEDAFLEQEKFRSPKPVSRDEVVRFLCSLFKGSYKGNLLPKSDGFTSQENARDLYNALVAEYEAFYSQNP